MSPRPGKRIWSRVRAAAVIAAAAAISFLLLQHVVIDWHRRRALEKLLDEVSRNGSLHTYLSGAPRMTPKGHLRRSSSQPRVDVIEATGMVIGAWRGADGAAAVHARAMADLVTGNVEDALRAVEKSVGDDRRNPAMWNDLAAIRAERAKRLGRAAELPAALVAVDQALSLNPSLAPARFNRAIIVEDLGFRSQAARAWRAFLDLDHDSEWSTEALRRLHRLNAPTGSRMWRAARDRLDKATDSEITLIVHSFPQQARTWAEVEILARWASAHLEGGESQAVRQLAIARAIGSALRDSSGEQLLAEAVDCIDQAAPAEADELARAHLSYENGRLQMAAGHFTEALGPVRDAARTFARLGSPIERLCRAYEANALAELQRNDEALAILHRLQEDESGRESKHRALAAQTLWGIGLCEALRGRWSIALDALLRSCSEFEHLGERAYQARVRTILGESYDVIGQTNDGWSQRVAAARLLADEGDVRSLHIVAAAGTFAAMRSREWEAARSLAPLDMEIARDSGEPLLIARAYLRNAVVNLRAGNPAAALDALRDGRASARQIPDPDAARRTTADLDVAEALISRETAPRRAIDLFTRAMGVYASARLDLFIPDLYLERGRTLLRIGDDDRAAREFDSGIDMLLVQRDRIPSAELRTGIFDNASGLFDEAVRLALRRGDVERAFRIVESSRARTLLDEVTARSGERVQAPSLSTVQSSLRDFVFVEFISMPQKVVALVLTREGLRSYDARIPAPEIDDRIESLTDLMTKRKPLGQIHAMASKLFDELLADANVPPHAPLVISADGALQRIPWAALYDKRSGRYLIEDHPLLIAPSAAVFLSNSARATAFAERPPNDVLVIGNPSFDQDRFPQLAPLPAAASEAAVIRGQYARGEMWLGEDATRTRFVRSAGRHEVIHFGGHAVAGSTPGIDSFLLFAPDPSSHDDGLEYAADVVRTDFASTRLVILAACSSLRGTTRNREGMPSIARSFLAAGVPAVVGTLWDIEDDVTERFFSSLHHGITRGLPAEWAAREVQLEMIHSSDSLLAHPASWAGIQVVGGSSAAGSRSSNDRRKLPTASVYERRKVNQWQTKH